MRHEIQWHIVEVMHRALINEFRENGGDEMRVVTAVYNNNGGSPSKAPIEWEIAIARFQNWAR